MDKHIVLFGINADPPHLGHLKVIQEVRKALGHSTLFIVMPTGLHPSHKLQLASAADRLAMTQLLFRTSTQVLVDDFEIKSKAPAYTLDTFVHLKAKYPHSQLSFIMSVDRANHFFSWHEPLKILALAQPIIVSRPGYHLDEKIRSRIMEYSPCSVFTIDALSISSTDIRAKLEKGMSTSQLSEEVQNYIARHRLYEKQ